MSFDAAEASFREFSKCVVTADLANKKLEFREAWIQNVVTLDEFLGQEGSAKPDDAKSEDEAYVVTGVIRTVPTNGPAKDNLAILLVRKVLDTRKVVNFVSNMDRDFEGNLQELAMGLSFSPYQGKCLW